MAPFVYDAPSAPLAGSIADLIQRGGALRGQAALETARINAYTQAQRAQLLGGMVNNISQIPLQYREQQRADAIAASQAQMRQLQMLQVGQSVQEHQQGRADQQALDSALRELVPQFRKPDAQGIPRVDFVGLGDALRDRQIPDTLIEPWMNRAMAGEDALDKRASQRRTQQQGYVDALARVAHDSETPEAFQSGLHEAVSSGLLPPETANAASQLATADYPSFRQTAQTLSPTVRSYYAELDSKAAQAEKDRAQAVEARNKVPTQPSAEQQLLTAKATGDEATYQRILGVIKDDAASKRDPVAMANAAALAQLSRDSAQARLDKLKEDQKDLDIGPDVQTTLKGEKYVDLSKFTGNERNRARSSAGKLGIVGVSKEEAAALADVDTARLNQNAILTNVRDLLPRDAAGRILAAPQIALAKVLQTNDQISAFQSWRTAAIQALRATAGKGGLRINQAEIEQAIENDIPKLTDTWGTAQTKVQHINTLLDNAVAPIITRDRSTLNPQPPTTGPAEPTPPTQLRPALQQRLKK